MTTDNDRPPAGNGVLAAYARLGVHELRNALYTESNVAQGHSEYGMWASPTPSQIVEAQKEGEVSEAQRTNDDIPLSMLDEKVRQAEARAHDGHDRGDREPQLEKE